MEILKVAEHALAAVGAIASILALFSFRIVKRMIGWREVTTLIRQLVGTIRQQDLAFDVVVGIRRSGAICAAMLAGNIGGLPVYTLNTRLRWRNVPAATGAQLMEADVDDGSAFPMLKDQRVLVVTCFNVTGVSPKVSMDYLQQFSPRSLTLLAMYESPQSQIRAALVGKPIAETTTERVLVGMPWMLSDSYQHPHLKR